MHLAFNSLEVEYSEALDGDIVQVTFQENPEPDIDYSKKDSPLPSPMKYISISANYEFSPNKAVEWCDGEEFDGGGDIRELTLTKSLLELVLVNGVSFAVSFNINETTFQNIKSFLLSGNDKFV